MPSRRAGMQAHDGHQPVDAAGVEGHLLAAVILQEPAQTVCGEVRLREADRRVDLVELDQHLRLHQLRESRVAHEPLSRDPPAVEQEAHPLRHVQHARVHRAGRRDRVGELLRGGGQRTQGVVDAGVRARDIGPGAELGPVHHGLRHAEWVEDPGADQVLPRASVGRSRGKPRDRVADVVVGESRPETALGRKETQPVDHLGEGQVAPIPQVLRVGEPDHMGQQVAEPHLAGSVGIVEHEPRQHGRDRVVPPELARVHHERHRQGGERLGRGAKGEQRMRVHRVARAGGAHAVPAREHHRVVLHDGHGHARDIPLAQGPGGVAVESRERRLDVWGRLRAGPTQRTGECQSGDGAEADHRRAKSPRGGPPLG